MINPFNEINWNPGVREIKSFGRTVLTGFLLIGAVVFLSGVLRRFSFAEAAVIPFWLGGAGIFVWLIARLSPAAARPLYLVWFFAAACMGIVVSNLILAGFFYLIFTPTGIVLRILSGRDPLLLKRDNSRKSNWADHKSKTDPARYFKQY